MQGQPINDVFFIDLYKLVDYHELHVYLGKKRVFVYDGSTSMRLAQCQVSELMLNIDLFGDVSLNVIRGRQRFLLSYIKLVRTLFVNHKNSFIK